MFARTPRIIDIILARKWHIDGILNEPRGGYLAITHHPTAEGLVLPIRFDHWYLPPNDKFHHHAYVAEGYGGHDAMDVLLMLPRTDSNGVERENLRLQTRVVQMRELLYSCLDIAFVFPTWTIISPLQVKRLKNGVDPKEC
jgi:hypothetical protein